MIRQEKQKTEIHALIHPYKSYVMGQVQPAQTIEWSDVNLHSYYMLGIKRRSFQVHINQPNI